MSVTKLNEGCRCLLGEQSETGLQQDAVDNSLKGAQRNRQGCKVKGFRSADSMIFVVWPIVWIGTLKPSSSTIGCMRATYVVKDTTVLISFQLNNIMLFVVNIARCYAERNA